MRFKRYEKPVFRDTPRKRKAYDRKMLAERNAYPLFAEEISEQQMGVDAEMSLRAERHSAGLVRDRIRHAQKWREGRARLRQYIQAGSGDYLPVHSASHVACPLFSFSGIRRSIVVICFADAVLY